MSLTQIAFVVAVLALVWAIDVGSKLRRLSERHEKLADAVNRLYRYVQSLDSDLDEERRLLEEFESDSGGLFSGMNHMEYVRDRRADGRRTLNDPL